MQHAPGEDQRREAINPGELRLLLERLEPVDPGVYEPPDYHATVTAVCEATGQPEHRVWEILEDIRRQDLEGRVTQVLNELEEPLYRVERPSGSRDPLSRESLMGRYRALDSALDHLPRPGRKRVKTPKELEAEKTSSAMTVICVVVMLVLVVGLALTVLMKGSGG